MADTATTDIPGVGCSWEELEIVDHNDGHLLFKAHLRRRGKKGAPETLEEVRIRIPRSLDLARSRVECRKWCDELGVDASPEKDKDIFDQLEQICILARATRSKDPPYAQLYEPKELAEKFDEASLLDLLGKMQAIKTKLDPRESLSTEEDVWRKVHAVAEAGHLLPLIDIAGHEHPSFIVFMAQQAVLSPIAVAWRRSHESCIPGRSPATTSTESLPASPEK